MSEIAADSAPELTDDAGVPDRLEDPLDAVGNVDDKTGEKLLILGARGVDADVILEGHRVHPLVEKLGKFGLDRQSGGRAEKAG